MSHAYSIRPTVDGELFRWVIWDKDDVTPLAQGTAASEDLALSELRGRAAAIARGEVSRPAAASPH